jgi:hypothetical protein
LQAWRPQKHTAFGHQALWATCPLLCSRGQMEPKRPGIEPCSSKAHNAFSAFCPSILCTIFGRKEKKDGNFVPPPTGCHNLSLSLQYPILDPVPKCGHPGRSLFGNLHPKSSKPGKLGSLPWEPWKSQVRPVLPTWTSIPLRNPKPSSNSV